MEVRAGVEVGGIGVEVGCCDDGVAGEAVGVDEGEDEVVGDGEGCGVDVIDGIDTTIGSAVAVGGGVGWLPERFWIVHPMPHATAPNRMIAPISKRTWTLGLGIRNLELVTTPPPL